MSEFMKMSSLDEILLAVGGTIDIYRNLKDKIEDEASNPDGALKLSIKFWSLSSTLSECIFQVSEHLRVSTTTSKMKYAGLVNEQAPNTAVSKVELVAKNNADYVKLLYDDVQKTQNYLDYLIAVKRDVDMAHYICKEAYTRQSEMFMATYRGSK